MDTVKNIANLCINKLLPTLEWQKNRTHSKHEFFKTTTHAASKIEDARNEIRIAFEDFQNKQINRELIAPTREASPKDEDQNKTLGM